jgi:hypothetical protein
MVSQAEMPGQQVVAGLLPGDVTGIADAGSLGPVDYAARALGMICAAAVDRLPCGGGIAVNYSALVPAALSVIPRHFGFIPDPADEAAMIEASRDDAKRDAVTFEPDGARKQAAASAEIRIAAAREIAPAYARLEAFAARQGSG